MDFNTFTVGWLTMLWLNQDLDATFMSVGKILQMIFPSK